MYILLSFPPDGEISDWEDKLVQIKIIIENAPKNPLPLELQWHSVNCSLLRKEPCCGRGFKMKSGCR